MVRFLMMALLASSAAASDPRQYPASDTINQEYSPKDALACCKAKCETHGCKQGCHLWIRHSSLNWRSEMANPLFKKCLHTCNGVAHHEWRRYPSTSLSKIQVQQCQTGCQQFASCHAGNTVAPAPTPVKTFTKTCYCYHAGGHASGTAWQGEECERSWSLAPYKGFVCKPSMCHDHEEFVPLDPVNKNKRSDIDGLANGPAQGRCMPKCSCANGVAAPTTTRTCSGWQMEFRCTSDGEFTSSTFQLSGLKTCSQNRCISCNHGYTLINGGCYPGTMKSKGTGACRGANGHRVNHYIYGKNLNVAQPSGISDVRTPATNWAEREELCKKACLATRSCIGSHYRVRKRTDRVEFHKNLKNHEQCTLYYNHDIPSWYVNGQQSITPDNWMGVSTNEEMSWIPKIVNGQYDYSFNAAGRKPQRNADHTYPGAKLKYSGETIETVVQDNGMWDACYTTSQCAASPAPEAWDCEHNTCAIRDARDNFGRNPWAAKAEFGPDGLTVRKSPIESELIGSSDCFVKEL